MTREIALTRGQVTLVDDEDYPFLSAVKWYCLPRHGAYYAARKHNGTTQYMHRAIMDVPLGMQVDHINHKGLDNRRCNLRICTQSENLRNRRSDDGQNSGEIRPAKDKVLAVRVTPAQHEAITTLSITFDMTLSAIVRAAIVLMLGDWTPFTAGEAQEVLREAADESLPNSA